MIYVIRVTVQILLTYYLCSHTACGQCLDADRVCSPEEHSIKCCQGTTCEPIEGSSDGFACRPNNNTCQTDNDCFINGISFGLKCLPWTSKCGMCKEEGRPCSERIKCCGYCDTSIGQCVDQPRARAKLCQSDNDCIVKGMYVGFRCLSETKTCGVCRDEGRPCSDSLKCCGYCDKSVEPIKGQCIDYRTTTTRSSFTTPTSRTTPTTTVWRTIPTVSYIPKQERDNNITITRNSTITILPEHFPIYIKLHSQSLNLTFNITETIAQITFDSEENEYLKFITMQGFKEINQTLETQLLNSYTSLSTFP